MNLSLLIPDPLGSFSGFTIIFILEHTFFFKSRTPLNFPEHFHLKKFFRAIYDSGDVNKFSRALEHRIHLYDKNIQKTCAAQYQDFVDSMKELMRLKERCKDIKEEVIEIDEQVQQASANVAHRTKEIVKYRKLMKNATIAIDQITTCLPVLENYAKLQELMEMKKYYQALKVLEELEHTHLALVEKYRFTQLLAKSMAPVRKEIKDKAYSEFKDFLENVKKVAGRTAEQHSFGVNEAERAKRIQEEAMKNAADMEITVNEDGSIVKKGNTKRNRRSMTNGFDEDETMSAQDIIDYTPVHRCCQIFNVLGAKEEFEQYYRQQRSEQCQIVIEKSSKMIQLRHYIEYLDEIIGFFVVEDVIMQTEPTLVTAAHRDQLWEMALKKIIHVMETGFGSNTSIEDMLRMKKVVLLFALTMKSYGYSVGPLYTLLQTFRDGYNEILMSEYCAQFEDDLAKDNYTPITVENEEQFRAVLKQFPFYSRSMETKPYPRTFPFSRFVISVYQQSKNYLSGCLKFMEHLQLTHSEIDDTVRKYANVLLERWSGSLKEFVKRKRSLVQLVQITVNIGYLEKSCESLGSFITKLTSNGEARMVHTSHQVVLSERVFRDARSEVEQQIDECVKNKVNEFMDLAQYDWELPAASGTASDYITDVIRFLETTFRSFSHLPPALARHVCMQTCKHIAERLMWMLMSPEVKAISNGALDQFNLDIIQCEVFSAKDLVEGLDKDTLSMAFAELRQLLDLIMGSDWTTYFAEFGKENGTYVRVKPTTAIAVMEKMIEYEKKSTGFFNPRQGDRKKLLDTILRQLRTLAAK
ncbi:hypothetical protein WR25_26425 isoform B [Diploscapter pachys]|uniref:Exocyst complex component n=1 Tax=Diploscapter pachys TaxID=2018661 RepID=A0A2A2JLC8_9BILA|nr:hypothetical protein WR25_26425 isoform A [Diploscapter pachys]PAV62596.1 hypothetical protein WR25_26425 isoform B [Diploscapter pachys]